MSVTYVRTLCETIIVGTYLEGKYNVVGHCTGADAVPVDVLVMRVALAVASDVWPRVAVVVLALRGQHHVRGGRRWSCEWEKNKTKDNENRQLQTTEKKQWRPFNTVPTNPPIRKQASWQKSNDKTSTNSFLPLKFSSMTPPAIVEIIFRLQIDGSKEWFFVRVIQSSPSAIWLAGRLDEQTVWIRANGVSRR